MICMSLSELDIYRSNKSPLSLLNRSAHVKMEGSVSKLDIQALNDMFNKGSVFLITGEEATEYLALKLNEETKDAEIKEEENNEEHN